MKKLILLLLLPLWSIAQTSTGQEQEFDYGIKNNSAQTVTSPTFLTTTGTDGTQGKSSNIVSQINSSNNSGILSGGALTVNADPTKFNIAEGTGYVMNSLTGVATKVTWATATTQTTPYLLTSVATYVLKDNAGATVLQNTAPTPAQYRTHIYIGKLAHTTFTTILFAVTEPSRMFDSTGQVADINKFLGSGNIEGNVITYNGANLNINASAGSTYRPGANYANDRNSPSITTESSFTAGTFRNKFRNGSGGWSAVNTTTIDPNYYDDGTGILALVPNNKWTIKVFWRFGGTGTIHCDYGQTVYDSKAQALEAVGKAVTSEDPETKRDASKRGWLVVKQGITVLNDITTAEFLQADKFGERASGGSSTATMQTAYDNSVTPQIITSTGLGAVALKRGSAADTDNVLVVQNGAGSDTFTVKGNGDITGGLYNSYTPANDANVAHLTGNETLAGIKSFTSAPRFDLGASFKSPSAVYQSINALNDGWALGVGSISQSLIFNTSTNYAYTFPSATGTIALTSDLSTYATLGTTQTITGNKTFTGQNTFTAASSSTAITVTASTSGNGITINNNSNGNGFTVNNNSTGIGEIINSATASTSDLTRWQKNGTTTAKVDHNGNITAPSFIKSGGTSSQFLKADGSVDATTYTSGTLTSGYIPKATGANSLGNSLIYDNGTNVGIGTTSPANPLSVFTSSSIIASFTRDLATDATLNIGADNDGTYLETAGINNLRFLTSGSERMRMASSGNVLIGTTTDDGVNKLQVNGSARISDLSGTGTRMVTADASGNLAASTIVTSGTYTPTLTNTSNITSSSLNQATYTRIGNIINVNVSVSATVATTATPSVLTLTLPINTADTTQTGVGVGNITAGDSTVNAAGILGVISASTAEFVFYPTGSGSGTASISFQYSLN